jgi:calcium/proton exchanger cax
MKKLSIVGSDIHKDEHVVGYCNAGDRIKYWGKLGAFWGWTSGLLFDSAFFLIPGIGPLMVAGPLVGCSLAVAVVLFVTYILWLIFSLITHRDLFMGTDLGHVASNEPKNSARPVSKAFIVLALTSIFIAVMSEFLAGSVETACKSLGLTEVFAGVIIVAIISNASEFTAVGPR